MNIYSSSFPKHKKMITSDTVLSSVSNSRKISQEIVKMVKYIGGVANCSGSSIWVGQDSMSEPIACTYPDCAFKQIDVSRRMY